MRTVMKLAPHTVAPVERKRVAAYARVSVEKDATLRSLSAQVSYYNKYISERRDWVFAGIYADRKKPAPRTPARSSSGY